MSGRTARLRAAAQKHAARARNPEHDAHNQIAHAVYLAIKDTPPEALLVPELYGPVVVAAEMAAKAVAQKAGLPWNDETRDEIVRYLVDGFTMMTYEFDVEHFELHKQRRAQGERLSDLARQRKPEVEAELARRRAAGE